MSLDALTDEVDWEERPPERPRWPLVVAGALLAFLAVYVAAAAWFGDRVPRGTTVSGVAVGGQSGDDATATLTTALGSVAAKPIVLTSTAGKVRTTPKALGLQVDVPGRSTAWSGSRCRRPRCGPTSRAARPSRRS